MATVTDIKYLTMSPEKRSRVQRVIITQCYYKPWNIFGNVPEIDTTAIPKYQYFWPRTQVRKAIMSMEDGRYELCDFEVETVVTCHCTDCGESSEYLKNLKCKTFTGVRGFQPNLQVLVTETLEVIMDLYHTVEEFEECFGWWCSRFEHLEFQRIAILAYRPLDGWEKYQVPINEYHREIEISYQYQLPWSRCIDDMSVHELFE